MILLINPPLVKPSEPPPGIARLYGTLRAEGAACAVIDANLEGILHLFGKNPPDPDRWTRRAVRNQSRNLDLIRSPLGYRDLQHYKRAVSDLNRLIGKAVEISRVRITLSDYQDPDLSPVRSSDLLMAAKRYENNPFYEYFSKRIPRAMELHLPDIVGISLNFLSQALTAFSIIGFIKARYERVRIVLGGSLVTSWGSNPHWKNPFQGLIDHVVSGPGEQPLLDLAGLGDGPQESGFPMNLLPCGIIWRPGRFCPTAHPWDATGIVVLSVPKRPKASAMSRSRPNQRPWKRDACAPNPALLSCISWIAPLARLF